jgi:putative transposase
MLTQFPCCYHITQRCQERRFLLRCACDRQAYLNRLREMSVRHSLSVLNYAITSNHIHLLVWAPAPAELAAGMSYLSGTAAQDYNRRKKREGAFWRGRYKATLIENGRHLARCFFYIEMNMVRAGVVAHPMEWLGGAYAEHAGLRQRYRIIDSDAVYRYLEYGTLECFRQAYVETLDQMCARAAGPREPIWSEAAAVGGKEWIEKLAGTMPESWRKTGVAENAAGEEAWFMSVGSRLRTGLMGMLERKMLKKKVHAQENPF